MALATGLPWFAATTPVLADLRLENQRSARLTNRSGEIISEEERTEIVFIGEKVARLDSGSESFIVRVDESVLIWLDHNHRAFARVSLPVEIQELLTDQERECFENFPQAFVDYEGSATVTDDRRTIGEWKTRRIHLEARHGTTDRMIEEDWWMTGDLPVDLTPFHLLVRSREARSTTTREWIGKVFAEGGYPVEREGTWDLGLVRHHRQNLKSVTTVEFDPQRYLPPPDYTPNAQIPIDGKCLSAPP